LVEERSKPGVQSGEENIKVTYDHYHMWIEFEISFDWILVSLMQLCLFIIYKSFTSKRSSKGGLGWRFANLALCVIEWKWDFLTNWFLSICFDFCWL
jgi:hypothetical protein